MEGPIGIARASGDAARQPGWTPLLSLMAMISLNLGIFNLAADSDSRWRHHPAAGHRGGAAARHQHLHIKERIYQTAFVFLVLFFAVVIYNDLMKALPGLAQRLP